jgi:hypothetical protein
MAFEATQKYKEGKYIIEKARVVKVRLDASYVKIAGSMHSRGQNRCIAHLDRRTSWIL